MEIFCLFGLRLNVPVNNFSVMSGLSYRFLGFTSIVELLMSQKTLPWPLFVNQGFYIPKYLLSCVDFKNGSCHFFFSLSRSRSKVTALEYMGSLIMSLFLVVFL